MMEFKRKLELIRLARQIQLPNESITELGTTGFQVRSPGAAPRIAGNPDTSSESQPPWSVAPASKADQVRADHSGRQS